MVDVDVSAERVTELRVLKRGDHIGVDGKYKGVPYFHHGIYLGHTIGVAHFSGHNKMDATIKSDDILVFSDKGKRTMFRFVYKSEKSCRPLEDVAKKAEEMVSNPEQWEAYDALNNNCEHFATWCKIDAAVSNQVEKILGKLFPKIIKVARDTAAKSGITVTAAKSGIAYCDIIC